ncbi:MAG: NRDE family protein [Rhodovibrionaceae bacterium]
MCSIVIHRAPESAWPVIFAGNRDEMKDRPWKAPARHWPDRPEMTAGLDVLAGGSWLGVNDHGVLACVLNRYGSLGPAADKRSRGELVLEALDHADAAEAAAALTALEPAAYRSFNLVIADSRDAFWIKNGGGPSDRIETRAIPAGLSMLTARDLNAPESPRIARYLPRFRAAPLPDVDGGDWLAWQELLASREIAKGEPASAMTVVYDSGFETVSSSLIALPAPAAETRPPVWRFAPGRPDKVGYEDLDLGDFSQSLSS